MVGRGGGAGGGMSLAQRDLVSMSGKGNCYERALCAIGSSTMASAVAESFFKTPKAELIWRDKRETRRKAELALLEYINGFYNPRGRHSARGFDSPLGFRPRAA